MSWYRVVAQISAPDTHQLPYPAKHSGRRHQAEDVTAANDSIYK